MTSDAFAQGILAMRQMLYRITCTQLERQADREDAVQEAIRKAWEKRGSLRDERHLQTWVVRILLNECHNMQRRNGRCMPVEEVYGAAQAAPPDRAAELRLALAALDERYRLPILLHYIEGMPIRQVARTLRVPVGTVQSRLARGRNLLKTALAEEVLES